MNSSRGRKIVPAAAVLLAFVLLATLNSAGYRYGASDQAFYIPAVLRTMDASLFPNDGPLIESQAKLTVIDEAIGGLSTATGLSLPWLFAIFYVITLGLLALAGKQLGDLLYRHRWTTAALVAALALRQAIARTGANLLESYFHQRQLASLALPSPRSPAALRPWLLILTARPHTTTTMWFGGGCSRLVAEKRWRPALVAVTAVGAIAGASAGGRTARQSPAADGRRMVTLSKDYCSRASGRLHLADQSLLRRGDRA